MLRHYLYILCTLIVCGVSYADETVSKDPMPKGPVIDTTSIFSWLMSTFAIILLICVLAYFLKKTRFVKVNKGSLAIDNQMYVGPKQRVVIIRAGSKKILLGVTQTTITYLCDIDDPKLEFEKIMSTAPSEKMEQGAQQQEEHPHEK